MQPIQELDSHCPYCGEPISLLVEYGQIGHSHIEDCQVCCRPITILVSTDSNDAVCVEVRAEDD